MDKWLGIDFSFEEERSYKTEEQGTKVKRKLKILNLNTLKENTKQQCVGVRIRDTQQSSDPDPTLGTRNCMFFISAPPHEDISIMKPLMHLYTNSARFWHHDMVISWQ